MVWKVCLGLAARAMARYFQIGFCNCFSWQNEEIGDTKKLFPQSCFQYSKAPAVNYLSAVSAPLREKTISAHWFKI